MRREVYPPGMRILAKLRALVSRVSTAWVALRHSPAVTAPTPEEVIDLWARALRQLQASDETPPPRPITLPVILPGVRPDRAAPEGDGEHGTVILAMDGGYKEQLAEDSPSAPVAWGGFTGNGALGPGLSFLGYPYLAELSQITEYRTPAESLSTEMTRTWLKLTNTGKNKLEDKIAEITKRLEELKVRDLFREAALKTEQFGRAHLFVSVKGQDGDRPRQLPLTTIEKDSLIGFTCIEPYWLTPYSWNSTRPEQPDFYKPQSWYVLGRKTHHTRLLTFIFREVPDLLKPAYDFSGISITQLMMPYVNRWLRTAKNVNDLINIFSIVNLSTNLAAMIQLKEDDPRSLISRMKAFAFTRDNKGVLLTDKATEELKTNNIPLGSLDKLQAQAQEHMATPARMPLIKFFGVVPTGLNATSEGEFQAWYDYVRALQKLGFGQHFKRVLELVQMDLYGPEGVDPDISFEFMSLYEPTPKEESELRKADSDRDGTYLDKSVVSADEVREKLKKDPKSGYTDLEGDAPEAPELTEFGLGEASAQNAHERSQEGAEAAHARQLEVQTAENE